MIHHLHSSTYFFARRQAIGTWTGAADKVGSKDHDGDHAWGAAVQTAFENERFRYTFSDDDKWRTKIRVPVNAERRKTRKKKKWQERSSAGSEDVDAGRARNHT